jgi:hypothetical protein
MDLVNTNTNKITWLSMVFSPLLYSLDFARVWYVLHYVNYIKDFKVIPLFVNKRINT